MSEKGGENGIPGRGTSTSIGGRGRQGPGPRGPPLLGKGAFEQGSDSHAWARAAGPGSLLQAGHLGCNAVSSPNIRPGPAAIAPVTPCLSRPLPPAEVRAPGSGALQPEPAGMGCVRAGSGTEAGSDLWPGGWCPAGFPSISFPRVGFLRIYNYSGLNSPDSSPLPAPPGQMRFLHASLRVPAHCARGRPGGSWAD